LSSVANTGSFVDFLKNVRDAIECALHIMNSNSSSSLSG